MTAGDRREVDATLTKEITCPFCGGAISDSWEIDFGPGLEGDIEFQCNEPECEKWFYVSRVVDVRYTSRELDQVTRRVTP